MNTWATARGEHGANGVDILHDIGTKDERKQWVEDFKDGKIDILFVYNMLLTGFDARRLKKLYLDRVIKAHNLLQALTRVNRTYKNFRYGYVVDFADIQTEFDKTNQAYPAVNPEVVAAQTIALPNADLIQQFHQTTAAFFDLIERHRAQNQELTTLRDWLLPMLMNGQVRVG